MADLYAPLDAAVEQARHWEVELPADVVEVYGRLEELEADARERPPTSEVHEAFRRVFDAGKDPRKDAVLLKAAASQWFAGTGMRSLAAERAKMLLAERGADIFAAFGPVMDRAAAALLEAHRSIGSCSLKGGEVPRDRLAWDRARAAARVTSKVQQLWSTFAMAGVSGFRSQGFNLLVIADVPPEMWWRTRPDRAGQLTGWDAVCLGWPLSLASPSTYRERVEGVLAVREDVEAQMELEGWAKVRGCGTEQPATRRMTALDL